MALTLKGSGVHYNSEHNCFIPTARFDTVGDFIEWVETMKEVYPEIMNAKMIYSSSRVEDELEEALYAYSQFDTSGKSCIILSSN